MTAAIRYTSIDVFRPLIFIFLNLDAPLDHDDYRTINLRTMGVASTFFSSFLINGPVCVDRHKVTANQFFLWSKPGPKIAIVRGMHAIFQLRLFYI